MTILPSTTCQVSGQSMSDLFYSQEQLKDQVLNYTNPQATLDDIRLAREYPGSPEHQALIKDATQFLAMVGNPVAIAPEDLVEDFLRRV